MDTFLKTKTEYQMEQNIGDPGNPFSKRNIVIEALWSRIIRNDNFLLFQDGLDDKMIVSG